MSPERRQQLGMLAASVSHGIAFQVPDSEEAVFVGGRVLAMLLGNGVDLLDMQSRGMSIDEAIEGGLAPMREMTRGVIEQRLLHEHEDTGSAH